jgi:hypothetical protein
MKLTTYFLLVLRSESNSAPPIHLLTWIQRLATTWTIWGLNIDVGSRFSAPVPSVSGPTEPCVLQWVQGFFAWGKVARAKPSRLAVGWNFGSLSSMVIIGSIALAGWSGIRIQVGTKCFSFSKRPDRLWGTTSLLLWCNKVVYLV